jgi:hypothetical protein
MHLFMQKKACTMDMGEDVSSNLALSSYRYEMKCINSFDFREARLTEADVTPRAARIFSGPQLARVHGFSRVSWCHSRPQVTRSRFNSLSVVSSSSSLSTPLPLRAPHSLPLAYSTLQN